VLILRKHSGRTERQADKKQIRNRKISINMFKSSLLVAFRNIWKNKFFSILNILGLTIGMVSFIAIMQYVNNEISYDNFVLKNTHRVVTERYVKGDLMYKKALTYPSVGPAIKDISPDVEDFTRLWKMNGDIVFSANERDFNIRNFLFADPSVLKTFSLNLVHGNPEKALEAPMSIILSKTAAKLFFDNENVINKTITVASGSDKFEGVVTGVFEDLPNNTHLDFQLLVSFATAELFLGGQNAVLNNWQLSRFYTYVGLKDGASPMDVEDNLAELISKHKAAAATEKEKLLLQPVSDIHLKSSLLEEMKPNGSSTTVYFLTVIAVFILVIAYVNYINMCTARSLTRAREVGVRKVMGAIRTQLSRQFLVESLLVNFISVTLAIIIIVLVHPYYKDLLGEVEPLFSQPRFWISIVFIFIGGSLLSGLYPAFVLSAFQPVVVLKGKFTQSRSGTIMRKSLVVFQYVISAALAISTFIVYLQIDFMLDQNLGINIDRTLVLKAPSAIAEDSISANKYVYFKNEVMKNPGVEGFAASTEIPGKEIALLKEGEVRRLGEDSENANSYYVMGIDSGFFKIFDVKSIAGKDLSGSVHFYENVVLNRAAAKLLGFDKPEDAVGARIQCFGTNKVVGVVENFNQQSLRNSYSPIIFYLRDPKMLYSYYSVKVNTSDLAKTLEGIEGHWKGVFPGNPFQYFFLDDFFNRQYKNDRDFRLMFTSFAVLAFVIASLGLFGLSSYSVIQQAKEIGIRKVLGAATLDVYVKLSFNFIKLVLIANVIALPLTYVAADIWLSNFAFHITVKWWMYIIPSLIIILLSLLVISYEVLKSSMVNPVKLIREA
jgi:putative ABC transport system permease protein